MQKSKSKMAEYTQRVRKLLPGGVHYNFRMPWEETPIHFTKASNSRLWDMDGKEYLDLYARFGASIVGHGNQEYNESLKDIIDRALSVSHCDLDAEALELIAKFIPSAEMIRFGLSGTEVVQNALRLARAYTGKNLFIRFDRHYHGNADNIMGGKSSSDNSFIPHDFVGDFMGTDGRATNSLGDQSYLLPWNNIEVLENFLNKKGDEIAAIITEPVCVNGGSILPASGYLEKMRKLCDKHNVVLIFDEIITGVRMGLGGAQKEFGVIPDLTTLGKAIAGGGVPVSALVGKKEIMHLLTDKKVTHAGTFNGYPLGIAAVKATLELLSRDNGASIIEMNKKVGMIHDILKFQADAIDFPLIIQGPDACAAYHCTQDILINPSDYTYSIMIRDIILNNNLAKHGILVSTFSRMYPNISLSLEDVGWFQERVGAALIEVKEIYTRLN